MYANKSSKPIYYKKSKAAEEFKFSDQVSDTGPESMSQYVHNNSPQRKKKEYEKYNKEYSKYFEMYDNDDDDDDYEPRVFKRGRTKGYTRNSERNMYDSGLFDEYTSETTQYRSHEPVRHQVKYEYSPSESGSSEDSDFGFWNDHESRKMRRESNMDDDYERQQMRKVQRLKKNQERRKHKTHLDTTASESAFRMRAERVRSPYREKFITNIAHQPDRHQAFLYETEQPTGTSFESISKTEYDSEEYDSDETYRKKLDNKLYLAAHAEKAHSPNLRQVTRKKQQRHVMPPVQQEQKTEERVLSVTDYDTDRSKKSVSKRNTKVNQSKIIYVPVRLIDSPIKLPSSELLMNEKNAENPLLKTNVNVYTATNTTQESIFNQLNKLPKPKKEKSKLKSLVSIRSGHDIEAETEMDQSDYPVQKPYINVGYKKGTKSITTSNSKTSQQSKRSIVSIGSRRSKISNKSSTAIKSKRKKNKDRDSKGSKKSHSVQPKDRSFYSVIDNQTQSHPQSIVRNRMVGSTKESYIDERPTQSIVSKNVKGGSGKTEARKSTVGERQTQSGATKSIIGNKSVLSAKGKSVMGDRSESNSMVGNTQRESVANKSITGNKSVQSAKGKSVMEDRPESNSMVGNTQREIIANKSTIGNKSVQSAKGKSVMGDIPESNSMVGNTQRESVANRSIIGNQTVQSVKGKSVMGDRPESNSMVGNTQRESVANRSIIGNQTVQSVKGKSAMGGRPESNSMVGNTQRESVANRSTIGNQSLQPTNSKGVMWDRTESKSMVQVKSEQSVGSRSVVVDRPDQYNTHDSVIGVRQVQSSESQGVVDNKSGSFAKKKKGVSTIKKSIFGLMAPKAKGGSTIEEEMLQSSNLLAHNESRAQLKEDATELKKSIAEKKGTDMSTKKLKTKQPVFSKSNLDIQRDITPPPSIKKTYPPPPKSVFDKTRKGSLKEKLLHTMLEMKETPTYQSGMYVWGYNASPLVYIFQTLQIFLGLSIHDKIMEIVNSFNTNK